MMRNDRTKLDAENAVNFKVSDEYLIWMEEEVRERGFVSLSHYLRTIIKDDHLLQKQFREKMDVARYLEQGVTKGEDVRPISPKEQQVRDQIRKDRPDLWPHEVVELAEIIMQEPVGTKPQRVQQRMQAQSEDNSELIAKLMPETGPSTTDGGDLKEENQQSEVPRANSTGEDQAATDLSWL